ncbi:MAG: glycosyltransferase [Gemmatimonadota bacterium]
MKTLVVVPTYNERDDAPRMVAALHALRLDADILFIDDASPDGTGAILEGLRARHPRLHVMHRSGKLGIGSAHLDGIAWAYAHDYQRLVTLDGDFSHGPEDIPKFLIAAETADVVVGSRWMATDSLPGWSLFRQFMTGAGHVLTRRVLGLPYDATGAFRVYRLDRIPQALFGLVRSRSYAFFFESLFILYQNACRVAEVPIVLPARTYGHSKMTTSAALQSVRILLGIASEYRLAAARFHLPAPPVEIDRRLVDPQQWDSYWREAQTLPNRVYAVVASTYRKAFIKPRLHHLLHRAFPPAARLLHAGCGGGQVDQGLHARMRITAVDISPEALALYQRHNPAAALIRHGDILALPFPDSSFDGYYSLGVVEHFTDDQLERLLGEAWRVLRPNGKAVLFWPRAKATSVMVLGLVHRLLNRGGGSTRLHPPEVSLLTSRSMAERCLARSRFKIVSYDFGARDLWIQAAIVAQKTD